MAEVEQKKRTGAVKKSPSGNKKQKQDENAITKYFRETRGEMRKVTWPTREEAQRLTIVVLIVTALFAGFLGVLDWLWSTVLEEVIKLIIGA